MPKLKILAVDDEPKILRLLQANLEREGYEVVTASDGQEALAMILQEHPDLVVCNIMMPKIDGLELLAKVRQNRRTFKIPFVILTTKAQDIDVLRGILAGADRYIIKPFDPADLIESIKELLKTRTTRRGQPHPLSYNTS